MAASRIVPEAVVFPAKELLKKREVRVIPLWPRLAAAASVVLVFGLGWWSLRGPDASDQRIARQEKEKPLQVPVPTERTTPAEDQRPEERQQEKAADTSVRKATMKEETSPARGHAPADRRSDPPEQPAKEVLPLRGTQPPDMPEPSLAQVSPDPGPLPEMGHDEALAQAVHAPAAAGGTTLATFVANAVRNEVLDSPARSTSLDGGDAVAAVDKGLHAITRGAGGMQVQRTGTRKQVYLRLGRNLAISASSGR
ncbi:MAG: hypothetical protein QM724_02555 [Flavobacteriales bacterium]